MVAGGFNVARRSERNRLAAFAVEAYREGYMRYEMFRSTNSFAKARAIEKRLAQTVGITRTVIRSRNTGREWVTEWPFCAEKDSVLLGVGSNAN